MIDKEKVAQFKKEYPQHANLPDWFLAEMITAIRGDFWELNRIIEKSAS